MLWHAALAPLGVEEGGWGLSDCLKHTVNQVHTLKKESEMKALVAHFGK